MQTDSKTMKQFTKLKKSKALFNLGFVNIISLPQLGDLRGVILANQVLTLNWNQNNQQNKDIETQHKVAKKTLRNVC